MTAKAKSRGQRPKNPPATNGKSPEPLPEVLTPDEEAAYRRVSPEAVLAEATAGRLPGRASAGERRFARAALAGWLKGGGKPGPVETAEGKKQSMLSVIGAFKVDATLEPMIEEIDR